MVKISSLKKDQYGQIPSVQKSLNVQTKPSQMDKTVKYIGYQNGPNSQNKLVQKDQNHQICSEQKRLNVQNKPIEESQNSPNNAY